MKLLLVALMVCVLFVFTACAGAGQGTDQGAGTQAPAANQPATGAAAAATDEPESPFAAAGTITYWVPLHPNAAQIISTWNDNEVFQEMERRTGVHVEFIHPPIGQETEQFNLMIASRDFPDIIARDYPGGHDMAIQQQIYRPLNEFVDIMPNFMRLVNKHPEIRSHVRTDSGYYFGWVQFNLPEDHEGGYAICPWAGPALRGDFLDALDLPIPETIDDWYHMLIAFRDELNVEIPFILPRNARPSGSSFVGTFGVANDFFQVDNIVKWGPMEPGFRDFLATMNHWFNEGLLDPDFASTGTYVNFYAEVLTTGRAGSIAASFQDIIPMYNSLFAEGEGRMIAVPYPVINRGDYIHIGSFTPIVENMNGRRSFLTTGVSDDRVEAIVRWRDNWYTDESTMLFNFGVEGRSFNMVNGEPVFTELLADHPDGFTYAVAAWRYKLFAHSYRYIAPAMPPAQVEAAWSSIRVWATRNTRNHMMPPSAVPIAYVTEFSRLMTEINDFRDTMILRFIMGVEPMENFDDYVDELRSMGIERAVELQQMGLDLFNAR